MNVNYFLRLEIDNIHVSFFITFFYKVHIFWEGHKILQSLHLTFDRHSEEKRKVEILKIFLALSEYMNFKEQSLGGFTSEDTGNFLLLQHKYSKSLSWAENLNKLFTVLGRKFKFSAQDSDLEYLPPSKE